MFGKIKENYWNFKENFKIKNKFVKIKQIKTLEVSKGLVIWKMSQKCRIL